jgi:hypothetical protein
MRVAFGVLVNTLTTSEWTADVHEVRIDRGVIQSIVTDQSLPDQYGYGVMYLFSGTMFIRPNETGITGSSPWVSLSSSSGNITLNAAQTGKTVVISSASRTASTVTVNTSTIHGLSSTNYATLSGLAGASGTTMNGTYTVTVTSTTQFTYTSAGTAGSATVTGATVQSAPAGGNISLTPAPFGDVYIENGGLDINGTISGNKNYGNTGLHRGVILQRSTTLSIASSIPTAPTTANTTAITWSSALKGDTSSAVANVTSAVGDGTTVTYTLDSAAPGVGAVITVTGVSPVAYNLASATVATSTGHKFTVTNAATGTYTSGGSVAINSMWASGANITIPVTGAYSVGLSAQFGAGTAYSVEYYVFIGSTLRLSQVATASATSSFDHNQINGILYLTAGDVVTFRAAASTSGKLLLGGGSGIERNGVGSVVLIGAWS